MRIYLYALLLLICVQPLEAQKKVNNKIIEVLKSDPSLNHLFEIITSVPGIGTVIACDMIIASKEFKNITDPKKFACYAGVVPF